MYFLNVILSYYCDLDVSLRYLLFVIHLRVEILSLLTVISSIENRRFQDMSWKTSCHSLKHYLKVLFSVFKEKGFKMKFCRFIAFIVTIFVLSACREQKFTVQKVMYNHPDELIAEKVEEFDYDDLGKFELVFRNFLKIERTSSLGSEHYSRLGVSIQANNLPENFEILIEQFIVDAEVVYKSKDGSTNTKRIDISFLNEDENKKISIKQGGIPYNFIVDNSSEITKYLEDDFPTKNAEILGVNVIFRGKFLIKNIEASRSNYYSGDYYTLYLDNKDW